MIFLSGYYNSSRVPPLLGCVCSLFSGRRLLIYIKIINWGPYIYFIQGDLGRSFRYGKPVEEVIRQRLPVSTFFGVMTVLILYAVCIPLGFFKAVKHNSWFDNSTSVLIFMGVGVGAWVRN